MAHESLRRSSWGKGIFVDPQASDMRMGSNKVETTKVAAFRHGRDSLESRQEELQSIGVSDTYRCHDEIPTILSKCLEVRAVLHTQDWHKPS